MIRRLFNKRKVTLDSNVLISGLIYNSSEANDAIRKSVIDDELMLTNIIIVECVGHSKKKGVKFTEEQILEKLHELRPEPIVLELAPESELRDRYYIRDEKDYKILFSVDKTNSELLVTGDNDYFDKERPVRGIRARIMRPRQYLDEGDCGGGDDIGRR